MGITLQYIKRERNPCDGLASHSGVMEEKQAYYSCVMIRYFIYIYIFFFYFSVEEALLWRNGFDLMVHDTTTLTFWRQVLIIKSLECMVLVAVS